MLDKSLEHAERDLSAGKPQVAQVIGAINELDINGVVVAPAFRPSLIESEPIAAILEAVIPADHSWTDHVERVAMTEMGAVIGVGNAAIMASATIGSNGPSLLPSGLLRLLGALRLLLALRLLGVLLRLLALRLLGALRLLAFRLLGVLLRLLALRLLGALLRLLALRLLGALRLLLVLRLLGALRLRLALRWLGFSSASALFLLSFLCECRNGGSEKQ